MTIYLRQSSLLISRLLSVASNYVVSSNIIINHYKLFLFRGNLRYLSVNVIQILIQGYFKLHISDLFKQ